MVAPAGWRIGLASFDQRRPAFPSESGQPVAEGLNRRSASVRYSDRLQTAAAV